MVTQRSLSLYELLEVSSSATFEEIEQAYQRIAAYLGPESLAVYSMLDSDDAAAMRTQLDEAYRTLSDPDRRAAYDRARKEDQNYPPLMVPAHSGDSTASVGRVHQESSSMADKPGREPDDSYATDRSDALGAWSSKDEARADAHDKHLPVRGRGQPRHPIRGPGSRTGRTPLYGRDVPTRDPAELGDASDVKAREQKPRYGRAAPPVRNSGDVEPQRTHTTGAARPQYGRWSTRHDEQSDNQRGSADSSRNDTSSGRGAETPWAPDIAGRGADPSHDSGRAGEGGSRGSDVGARASDVGARGSDVGSRASDFGARASDVGSRGSDVGSRPSDFGPRGSDVGSRPSDFGPRGSDVGSRASDFGSRGSDVGSRPSDFGSRGSDVGSRPSDFGSLDPESGRSSDYSARPSDVGSRPSDSGPADIRPRPADPRSSDLWAPDSRTDSRTWSGSHDVEYRAPEPEPRYPEPRIVDPRPPEPRFTESRAVERLPEPRVEPRPSERAPEARPPSLPQRFSDVRTPEPIERPELIKTVSDVVEPRQRPTIPPPAAMSASAKPKRRILSPSAMQEITPETEFGGGFLRKLRESTGATLDEVAEITKVSKRYLIAIETNDFAAMPAAVYTRGFVVEYARVLGLDPQPVAKSFMALYAKHRGVGG